MYADVARRIATFEPVGTLVVFAGAPVSGPNSAGVGRLNSRYRELAESHDGVWYADAGSAVLADASYTITLPCLSSEPCEGGYEPGNPTSGYSMRCVRRERMAK